MNTVVATALTMKGTATTIAVIVAVAMILVACYLICKRRYVALVVPCVVLITELIFWTSGGLILSLTVFCQKVAQQYQMYFVVGENTFTNKIWLCLGLIITSAYHYCECKYRISKISIEKKLRLKMKLAEEEFHEGPDVQSAISVAKNWYANELKDYENRIMLMNVLAFLVCISRFIMFLTIPLCLVALGIVEQILTRLICKVWNYGEFAELKREILAKKKERISQVNYQWFERVMWSVVLALEVGSVFNIDHMVIAIVTTFALTMIISQIKVLQWQGRIMSPISHTNSAKAKVILSAKTLENNN